MITVLQSSIVGFRLERVQILDIYIFLRINQNIVFKNYIL